MYRLSRVYFDDRLNFSFLVGVMKTQMTTRANCIMTVHFHSRHLCTFNSVQLVINQYIMYSLIIAPFLDRTFNCDLNLRHNARNVIDCIFPWETINSKNCWISTHSYFMNPHKYCNKLSSKCNFRRLTNYNFC